MATNRRRRRRRRRRSSRRSLCKTTQSSAHQSIRFGSHSPFHEPEQQYADHEQHHPTNGEHDQFAGGRTPNTFVEDFLIRFAVLHCAVGMCYLPGTWAGVRACVRECARACVLVCLRAWLFFLTGGRRGRRCLPTNKREGLTAVFSPLHVTISARSVEAKYTRAVLFAPAPCRGGIRTRRLAWRGGEPGIRGCV